ncbi:MAG: H-NS histone family protein [Hyphomicrobium sp.]
MARPDLTGLSLKQLEDLRAKIEEAINETRVREKAELKQKFVELAAKSGLTLNDVLDTGRRGKKVGVKYQNPDNPSETWTGRGRKPNWLVARLGKSGKLEQFLIKK